MARKQTSSQQPLLPFPSDTGEMPVPQENDSPPLEGSLYAVQDDHPPTPPAASGDARATPQGSDAVADAGTLRQPTEDPPRNLEGPSLPSEAGQRPEPDRERGFGDGSQGTGELFTFRVSAERQRNAFAGRSHGVHPPSHAARVKASRG